MQHDDPTQNVLSLCTTRIVFLQKNMFKEKKDKILNDGSSREMERITKSS
jgi:hypothetical protein